MARRSKGSMDRTSRIILIAMVVVGLVLAFIAGRAVFNLVKGWSLTSLPGAPVEDLGASSNNPNSTSSNGPNITTAGAAEAKTWDGKSRVNILLLGIDATSQREIYEPGPRMSDTMILVSIDPLSQTMSALSIRRDLWVNIPGYDYHKINKAYFIGEAYQLPGGGPGLAVQTVEEFLGVPINYFARVDFDTFVKLIDEIDGVKLDITDRILADWNGNGHDFYLEPGTYTLPGVSALAYARFRDYNGDGDVGRGARQMQVITAVRDRILDFNMLPTLLKRAPAIYNDISKGVQTNMTFDQAVRILTLVMQMPRENFKTYNIDYTMCEDSWVTTLEDGTQSVLIPYTDKIRELTDQIFATDGIAAAPIVTGTQEPAELAKAENARITILNGTSTESLAESTGEFLKSQGLNVIEVGSASEPYSATTIVISGSTPYSLAYLSQLMQVPSTRIYNKFDPNNSTDITVFLGSDWSNSNPMP